MTDPSLVLKMTANMLGCTGTSKADITHQQVSSSSSSPDQASKWSSDHESDSDDSLQPYDLDEEEDDGGENYSLFCCLSRYCFGI